MRTEWELIDEDAPVADGVDLHGRHLHKLRCPNDHYLLLNSPVRTFASKDVGETLACVQCPAHWPAPTDR
jgi:hypothetical protein